VNQTAAGTVESTTSSSCVRSRSTCSARLRSLMSTPVKATRRGSCAEPGRGVKVPNSERRPSPVRTAYSSATDPDAARHRRQIASQAPMSAGATPSSLASRPSSSPVRRPNRAATLRLAARKR
jgi:hypothetical protein